MGCSILVAEDERNLVEALSFLMQRAGMKSMSRAMGRARWNCRRIMPDLVILDIMLPGFDGFTVVEAIRARAPRRTPRIIMLTAKGHEKDKPRRSNSASTITLPSRSPTAMWSSASARSCREADAMTPALPPGARLTDRSLVAHARHLHPANATGHDDFRRTDPHFRRPASPRLLLRPYGLRRSSSGAFLAPRIAARGDEPRRRRAGPDGERPG